MSRGKRVHDGLMRASRFVAEFSDKYRRHTQNPQVGINKIDIFNPPLSPDTWCGALKLTYQQMSKSLQSRLQGTRWSNAIVYMNILWTPFWVWQTMSYWRCSCSHSVWVWSSQYLVRIKCCVFSQLFRCLHASSQCWSVFGTGSWQYRHNRKRRRPSRHCSGLFEWVELRNNRFGQGYVQTEIVTIGLRELLFCVYCIAWLGIKQQPLDSIWYKQLSASSLWYFFCTRLG